MLLARTVLFLAAAFILTGGIQGQEAKKEEPKKEEPKLKGFLPMGWRDIGLSEAQKQQVYKVQAKYGDDIEKLEAQIKELKGKMNKERLEILSAEQKKKLEDYFKSKTGSTDK